MTDIVLFTFSPFPHRTPTFTPTSFTMAASDDASDVSSDPSDRDMVQILKWIGFTSSEAKIIIRDIPTLEALASLKVKKIETTISEYAKREDRAERLTVGLARRERLLGAMHWTQDCYRLRLPLDLDDFNKKTFLETLALANDRADMREELKSQSEVIAKDAAPGPLKADKSWEKWEKQLKTYLSSIIGAYGIPIVYVIREDETSTLEQVADLSYLQQCIAMVPLSGYKYTVDALSVHKIIAASVEGELSEDWIADVKKYGDGRKSFRALWAHFEGAGKTSRRIAQAEKIRTTIFYKNERALPFSTFLNRLQQMFNIYEEEEEPFQEKAKTRLLLERVQNPQLAAAVESLKVRDRLDGGMDFTAAANHLASEVAQLQGAKRGADGTRSISATSSTNASSAILDSKGKIITGFIPGWRKLSQSDRELVFAERERLGLKGGRKKHGGGGGSSNSKGSTSKQIAALTSKVQSLTDLVQNAKRTISSLTSGNDAAPEDAAGSAEPANNAGDAFGGRRAKAQKKNTE